MQKIREIMTKNPVTVSPDTPVGQAARILLSRHINGLPVVDAKGDLVGLLCQSDLVAQQKKFPVPTLFTLLDGFIPLSSTRKLEKELEKMSAARVEQAMTPDPVTVSPDDSVEEAATLMVDKKFHTLPVVEKGRLVGVVGKEDVLRTILDNGDT